MLWSSEAHQLGVHLAFCASELYLNASPDMSLSLWSEGVRWPGWRWCWWRWRVCVHVFVCLAHRKRGNISYHCFVLYRCFFGGGGSNRLQSLTTDEDTLVYPGDALSDHPCVPGFLIKLLFRPMTEETHPASWHAKIPVAVWFVHLFHITRDTSQSQRIWTLAPGSLSENSKLHFFSAFCSCSLVYARIIFGIMLQLQCNIKGNFDALWPLWKDVTPGQRHLESLRGLTVAGHCAKCELHWNEGLLWVLATTSKMMYLNDTLFIGLSLGPHWPHQHMVMIRCCSQETWGV